MGNWKACKFSWPKGGKTVVICGKRNQNSLSVVMMEGEEFGGDIFDIRQTMSQCPDSGSDIFLNHQVIFGWRDSISTCLESIHSGVGKITFCGVWEWEHADWDLHWVTGRVTGSYISLTASLIHLVSKVIIVELSFL